MSLTPDESRRRNTEAERRKRETRAAAGGCRACGAPLAVLDPVSGKPACSGMCRSPCVSVMYASCVLCRTLYVARADGAHGRLCPDPVCRRKREKLEREKRRASIAEYGKGRREERLAEGLCGRCGAPAEELGGKMACTVPCKERWMTPIAYATCLFCKEVFVSRSRGKVSSLCRKPECQRKMAGLRNKRHTPSENARTKAKASSRARTHAKRTTVSDITPEQETAMRKKAKDCPLCGVRMTDEPKLPNSKELDHIVPLNAGGTHTHGNARIICRRCNRSRPHDGSDFTGQLTLWAQGPAPVSRPRRWGGFRNGETCRKGLHPWPESAVTLWGQPQCGPCLEAKRGAGYVSRIGTRRKRVRGEAARLEMAGRIQGMRAEGMSLRSIARELGYSDSKPIREMLKLVEPSGMSDTHTQCDDDDVCA